MVRGFSLVVRDVTERRRLEDDLRRRAEDLAAANRAKEEFLATLTYELRTPLNDEGVLLFRERLMLTPRVAFVAPEASFLDAGRSSR